MEASGTIDKDQAIEFSALEGSLNMMSKGLGLLNSLPYQAHSLQFWTTSWTCKDLTIYNWRRLITLKNYLTSNRMDSGRLESVSQVYVQVMSVALSILIVPLKPYIFHQVMQSMFIPLQLATNARGLELVINLDTSIDEVYNNFCMSKYSNGCTGCQACGVSISRPQWGRNPTASQGLGQT